MIYDPLCKKCGSLLNFKEGASIPIEDNLICEDPNCGGMRYTIRTYQIPPDEKWWVAIDQMPIIVNFDTAQITNPSGSDAWFDTKEEAENTARGLLIKIGVREANIYISNS